jgi:simple sugar transport system permease protein
MTAIAAEIRLPGEIRRARILGVVELLLAGVVLIFFARGVEGDAEFRLVQAGERFTEIPPLTVPAAGLAYVAAAALAFLGAVQTVRGFGRRANLVLGAGLVLFVFAFLGWAAAGKSFSLVGMLESTVVRAVPIGLGALAGVLCERVAVVNIAIEGMLLAGAFTGAVVGSVVNGWVGMLAALLVGGALAWVLGVLAIRYRVDQIIIGVVINLFVLGLTNYLTAQVLVKQPELNDAPIFRPFKIPVLGDIPILGSTLFNHTLFVYGMFILVAAVSFGLFRTRWGLRSRAVGEHPKAADTLGINVYRTRYRNVIMGGMVAGFGGAWFTLGSVGRFDENMTGGRGFIGLAAMIFGRWHPVGAMAAALVFGFADSLQQKLAILNVRIPSEFLLMAPYLVTIIVVAGLVGRARMPAADGQPYVKE